MAPPCACTTSLRTVKPHSLAGAAHVHAFPLGMPAYPLAGCPLALRPRSCTRASGACLERPTGPLVHIPHRPDLPTRLEQPGRRCTSLTCPEHGGPRPLRGPLPARRVTLGGGSAGAGIDCRRGGFRNCADQRHEDRGRCHMGLERGCEFAPDGPRVIACGQRGAGLQPGLGSSGRVGQ